MGGVACVSGSRGTVKLSKLDTAEADDTLLLGGTAVLPLPFTPPLNPVATGLRFSIVGASGDTVTSVTIPGGAFDPASERGWKVDAKGQTWTYRRPAASGGVVAASVKTSSRSPGSVKLRVVAKKGSYAVDAADLPLQARVVLDPASEASGQCGEFSFPGTAAPQPRCTLNRPGSTATCR
jgi:hypothetical protein